METTNSESGQRKGGFNGKPGPGRTPGVPQVKRPKELQDMERVYKTEEKGGEHPDDTPGQALFRELCRTDPGRFLAMLQKARSEYQTRRDKAKVRAEATAPAVTDEGSKNVIGLIEQLLSEVEEELNA